MNFEQYQVTESNRALSNWDGCSNIRLYLGNGNAVSVTYDGDATVSINDGFNSGTTAMVQGRIAFVRKFYVDHCNN